jgi:hypothetical protein
MVNGSYPLAPRHIRHIGTGMRGKVAGLGKEIWGVRLAAVACADAVEPTCDGVGQVFSLRLCG